MTMRWIKYASRFHPPLSAKPLKLAQAREAFRKTLDLSFGFDEFIMVEGEFFIGNDALYQLTSFLKEAIDRSETQFLLQFRDRCHSYLEALDRTAREIKTVDDAVLSVEDCRRLLLTFSEQYQNACSFIPIFRPIGRRIEEVLRSSLEAAGLGNTKEQMYFLTQSTKETGTTKEHVNLLRIASHIETHRIVDYRVDQTIRAMVREHCQQFSWIGFQWYTGAPLAEEDINNRLDHLMLGNPNLELRTLRSTQEEVKRQINAVIHGSKLDDDVKVFLDLAQHFAFLRTYRSDMINQSIGLVFGFLNRIAAMLRTSYEELIYFTPDEVLDALEGKPIERDILSQRKRGFGSLFIKGHYSIITGAELKHFMEEELILAAPNPMEEITGVVACRGRATGAVKIVRSVEDISDFKAGNILVAVMTFPVYMPAMERAAAIVTDDGGILSHAAIVARELQKPCIIDTNIATQVLADGEIVEVRAEGEAGVVKRLAGNGGQSRPSP